MITPKLVTVLESSDSFDNVWYFSVNINSLCRFTFVHVRTVLPRLGCNSKKAFSERDFTSAMLVKFIL
jgi:hypothetical protein